MSAMIDLALSVEEVNQVLGLLGDQPIKSGLSDLTTKIKTQGEHQIAKQMAATEVPVEIVD